MFEALYTYFMELFNAPNDSALLRILRTPTGLVDGGGSVIYFRQWFAFILALISEITIIILCCLFIAKIVKLFGKLFSGGTL